MLWLMPAKRERERRSNKKCTSAENEIFQMHFLWDFFSGVCRNSFFSPLLYKWFCKWSIYTVCNPFRLPVLINYITKLKKFKKEDVSLHFLRFKRSFLWKDFFLMPLSKEATEVCVTLRPDIPVTLFSTSVIKTSQDFERNHHLFQAARFLVLERLIDLTDNGSNWFEE